MTIEKKVKEIGCPSGRYGQCNKCAIQTECKKETQQIISIVRADERKRILGELLKESYERCCEDNYVIDVVETDYIRKLLSNGDINTKDIDPKEKR